jgi:hypothetical protein
MVKDKDFIKKVKRRLVKTLINGYIIRKVFKGKYIKELQILYFINNYNY